MSSSFPRDDLCHATDGPSTAATSAALHSLTGQLARLLHPRSELRLIELIVFADVEVANLVVFGFPRRSWTQRRAAEERHLYVLREAMEVEEPAVTVGTVERRVPLDRLAHAGDCA